jgi:hypothetical protein
MAELLAGGFAAAPANVAWGENAADSTIAAWSPKRETGATSPAGHERRPLQ